MDETCPSTRVALLEHFTVLEDPRIERTKKHSMTDILVISICGFICGVDDWVELEAFGEAKEKWFRTFLDLPNGFPRTTPSGDSSPRWTRRSSRGASQPG